MRMPAVNRQSFVVRRRQWKFSGVLSIPVLAAAIKFPRASRLVVREWSRLYRIAAKECLVASF
jgi:hypothetical protein